ncbi:MAG: LLM class flavin-dependent oxidoreductase [Nitrososphaerales archaeon]|jgi:G6PDH family F420-dependent oxidoreductase
MKGRLKLGLDASFMMSFDDGYSLKYLVGAEKAGFDHLWLGDHFLPWHDSFEHSFFVWEVLAAVAARTKRIVVGPDVTVPIGGRYHPAMVAQASATMARMFPGRFVLGVGSGESMNEKRFLGFWPRWEERMDRLVEGVELIKKLWTEADYFDFHGRYFKMDMVLGPLRPEKPIPVYFSAIGEKSCYAAGEHADRLLTVGTVERCRDVILPRFEAGARSAGRDPRRIEKAVAVNFATGPVKEVIARERRFIAGASIGANFNQMDPRLIEKSAAALSDEQILDSVYLFEKGDDVIEVMSRFRRLGIDQVVVSELSADPEKAMRIYSKQVIPYFRGG